LTWRSNRQVSFDKPLPRGNGCAMRESRRFSSFSPEAARCPPSCGNGPPRTRFRCWCSARARKSRPSSCAGTRAAVRDGNDGRAGSGVVGRLKLDAFTPSSGDGAGRRPPRGTGSSVVGPGRRVNQPGSSPRRAACRLDAMLVRTERTCRAPSTRLPGTTEIEREIRRRLEQDQEFAVCYADLRSTSRNSTTATAITTATGHLLLSRILHDVVRDGWGRAGSWSHRRGRLHLRRPGDEISPVCSEILDVFDTLTPLQYNDQDRRAGYFFGTGPARSAPPGTADDLSIGIVTNRHRKFAHPAQVSELATEMKTTPRPCRARCSCGPPAGQQWRGAIRAGSREQP